MLHLRNGFVRMSIFAGCVTVATMTIAQPPDPQQILNLGLRGVYFVPNEGQWRDRDVIYGLRSRGIDVAFRESALTMHMSRQSTEASPTRERGVEALTSRDRLQAVSESNGEEAVLDDQPPSTANQLTLTVTFPGSNAVEPIGAQPQTATFNYFVGGEGRNTAANVPTFAGVVYENLYDGIDLHVAGSDDGVLKYEFHVAPGADYNQIQIRYDGIDSLCIDDTGDLHINAPVGTLRDAAPVVWCAGSRTDAIPARFELTGGNTYRIALDKAPDPSRELIIDPDVDWSRYLGGSSTDAAFALDTDVQGNIYVTGQTHSPDFDGAQNTPKGGSDVFVTSLGPNGELHWMTYLGGRGIDKGNGIALSGADRILVTGETSSPNFEGRLNSLHGGFSDAFLASVDHSGAVQAMLYLGGYGTDVGQSMAIDSAGNAFISGYTQSDDFVRRLNERHGGSDAFIVKVSAAGEIVWMRYFGGSSDESNAALALDAEENIFVAGRTASGDFEGQNNVHHGGSYDAFALRVSPGGDLQWMSYLGGSREDMGAAVAVDGEGNALVIGQTGSPDFEGALNTYHNRYDAFVAKVSSDGATRWMTFLGGVENDEGYGIAIDADDAILATGNTRSWDFEGQNNTSDFGGQFVVRLTADGLVRTMYFIGGSVSAGGNAIAAANGDRAITVGTTASPDLPGRINELNELGDGFAMKLRVRSAQLSVASSCPNGGPIQVSWTDATPGAPVALVYAPDPTWYVIPEGLPCFDSLLNIGGNGLRVVFRGGAGPNGSRTLNSSTVPGACGKYLQLIELSTCDKSNVARIE